MSKKRRKEALHTLLPVPEYVSDPEKLRLLSFVADLDPEMLLATVEQDYAQFQLLAHPAIYEARGAEKGGLLIHILEQCKSLAEGFEKQESGGHLSRTLQHVQAHLAVLIGDYEEQLRAERRNP